MITKIQFPLRALVNEIIVFYIFQLTGFQTTSFIAVLGPLMKIMSSVFMLLTPFISITAISVSSHPYFGRADDEDLM